MKVSIITPSYNQGQFLEETILSVLNQTYKNIEYLIIDGGSEDNSVEVIKKYGENITYWVSEPDKGQADAINKGLRLAKGDLVCWINSDDILYPDFISERVRQFNENPQADMIYGDVEQGYDLCSKRVRRGQPTDIKEMLTNAKCPIPQQSTVWRRSVLEKAGYLGAEWHVLLDREYFTRVAAKCNIMYVPGAAAFFRYHDQSKSISETLKWAEELPVYYESVFFDNIYNLSDEILANKNRCLSQIYLRCARIMLKADDKQAANKFFKKAKKASLLNYVIKHSLKFRF